jgi:hypothetical protein
MEESVMALFDAKVVRLGAMKARAKRKLKEASDAADAALKAKDAPRAERLLAIARSLEQHIKDLAVMIHDDPGDDLDGDDEEKHHGTGRSPGGHDDIDGYDADAETRRAKDDRDEPDSYNPYSERTRDGR